ncbi:glutamine--fructose-6-phosphate transaminase (isomerizing) [Colwellia piezophila]|uniref:glutamine--fructose-6-phosphate transaminase (isomerizing) n=1 Tax=Colwellia piezophila TaxID=211668 RepID=UPI000366C0D7|nr:glutamine--fructose-6-phosphate transaminase (isomerizing) [Colwellia piezophila]
MCGIIGVVAKSAVKSVLEGLGRLEYRGYDSSGISILSNNKIHTIKAEGKLTNLKHRLSRQPIDGDCCIGHTRWATHGRANVTNAHPHQYGQVSVVHNGIIENYLHLKQQLMQWGHHFNSSTDSEVIPHLINHYLAQPMTHEEAIEKAIGQLKGSYALGVLINGANNNLYAVKQGSPLVISQGSHGAYMASDAMALGADSGKIYYPEDNELITLNSNEIKCCSRSINKKIHFINNKKYVKAVSKGEHSSFMEKEIFEQVDLLKRLSVNNHTNEYSIINFKDLNKITIIACGTSYYAASVAKTWFEQYANILVEVDIASEYRYRSPVVIDNELTIFVSQSGETADTLAALRYAKSKKAQTLALVNAVNSSIAREANFTFEIYAGPEIGVASTKAFSCQLAIFYKMALEAAKQTAFIDKQELTQLALNFVQLPYIMEKVLQRCADIKLMAKKLCKYSNILFLGRGVLTAIAQEGALKLKEISYIHAEAYAAGELKHGPIALLDEQMPVLVIAPKNSLTEKLLSNIKEVQARNAPLFIIGDHSINEHINLRDDEFFELPAIPESILPIISVIPMQLLALYSAQTLGKNVDQPRNLAKSVTVE